MTTAANMLRTFIRAIDTNQPIDIVEAVAVEYAHITGNDYGEDRGYVTSLADINEQIDVAQRCWQRMRKSRTAYKPAVEHAANTLCLLVAKRTIRIDHLMMVD